MRTISVWTDRVPDREKNASTIWSVAFRPDGTQVLAAAANRVLIYDAADGELVHSLKGHKDAVFAVAYSKQGKKFASGGADKQVIIWTSKAEGILKYAHMDSIQCLAYNPVTQQLASGTASDLGLWSPEQKSVTKHKTPSKILSMSWTADGLHLALGLFNGHISIRDKFGTEKTEIVRRAPIWCLAWSPAPTKADPSDVLAVGCWDRTISYYKVSGQEVYRVTDLDYEPCCLAYFTNGDFLVVGGSGKKLQILTREGVPLGDVAEKDDWVWAVAVRPNHHTLALGTNNGIVSLLQVMFSTVHGLYQDRYAYRDVMTDVIIQHLVTEQKVRIRCKDYVKKIAVYRDRLAVQLPDKVLIYEVSNTDPTDMHYKHIEKIKQRFECSLLVVTTQHILLCQEKRLQLYNFHGILEREWHMESLIRYIKVVGGASKKEGLLVGLKSGTVLKVFVNNPFPVTLIKQTTAVRCLDLSCSRRKLAVVDEVANLLVYDVESQELLFQEPNANSVAWNTEMEDMLAYSGNQTLSIKTGEFPPHVQKLQGFVVGFNGSRIFCLHYLSMQTVDVPQSASLFRYMEKKDYQTAYTVACLGVTDADWRALAVDALQNCSFDIARKAFIRIREIKYLDLLTRICNQYKTKSSMTPADDQMILAQVQAFHGKYAEAAQTYAKAKQFQKIVEMFTDLRRWDDAKHWAAQAEKYGGKPVILSTDPAAAGDEDGTGLLLKQAASSEEDGDLRAAGEMYMRIKKYKKAADLFIKMGSLDALIACVREVDPNAERGILQSAVKCFKKQQHFQFAKETLLKMSEPQELIALYMEYQRWEEAFALAQKHKHLEPQIQLPWAEWLVVHDRFDEAKDSYMKAGRRDLALKMLKTLIANSVEQRRFKEAAEGTFQLAVETIGSVPADAAPHVVAEAMAEYDDLQRVANIYYAYSFVRDYIEEPFTTMVPEHVFQISLYLWNILSSPKPSDMAQGVQADKNQAVKEVPHGVSRVYILYALAKQGQALGAFKLARTAFHRTEQLVVPAMWQPQIDLACLGLRSRPYSDSEDLMSVCNRCMTTNPLLRPNNDSCITCSHPFIRSFLGFEVLPLVEFAPEPDIPPAEILELIKKETKGRRGGMGGDGWRERVDNGAETLIMDGDGMGDGMDEDGTDLFVQKMLDAASYIVPGEPYQVVRVDRETLAAIPPEEVYIVDRTQHSPYLPVQFFRLMIPDIPVTLCKFCGRFYHQETWELEYLKQEKCPFCGKKDCEWDLADVQLTDNWATSFQYISG
jgi:intraflagellar transport protein 122